MTLAAFGAGLRFYHGDHIAANGEDSIPHEKALQGRKRWNLIDGWHGFQRVAHAIRTRNTVIFFKLQIP
ncbi:MAG: hypothetical protein DDT25_00034 [Chloroflexi bacterium]|nr:hypothetical protein [Chloroflexota bacterium]